MYAILQRLFFWGEFRWIFWMLYYQLMVEISILWSRLPFPHYPSPCPWSSRCGWQHWGRCQVPTEKRQIFWRDFQKFHSSPRYIDFPSASYWQPQLECAFLQNQQLSVALRCPPRIKLKKIEDHQGLTSTRYVTRPELFFVAQTRLELFFKIS